MAEKKDNKNAQNNDYIQELLSKLKESISNYDEEQKAAAEETSDDIKVNISELMDIPLRRDTSELSEEELHLLHLYRKSRYIPQKMRSALRETLETTINLYITSAAEYRKEKKKTRDGKNK